MHKHVFGKAEVKVGKTTRRKRSTSRTGAVCSCGLNALPKSGEPVESLISRLNK